MTCIRFDFAADLSQEKQDAFLAGINSRWNAAEEAGRLDGSRHCYVKLIPGQVDEERIARSLAAALRATPGVEDAFIVDEGWPISD